MGLVDWLMANRTQLELAKDLARTTKDNAHLQERVHRLETEIFWLRDAVTWPNLNSEESMNTKTNTAQQGDGELPQDERLLFEAELKRLYWPLAEADLLRTQSGDYNSTITQSMWDMWQARAALAQRAGSGDAESVAETPQAHANNCTDDNCERCEGLLEHYMACDECGHVGAKDADGWANMDSDSRVLCKQCVQPTPPAAVQPTKKLQPFYFSKQRGEILPDPKRVADPLYYLASAVDALLIQQPDSGRDAALSKGDIALIAAGLDAADKLIDMIPTRLHKHADESIARIGEFVNMRGGYNSIASAKRKFSALVAQSTENAAVQSLPDAEIEELILPLDLASLGYANSTSAGYEEFLKAVLKARAILAAASAKAQK